MKENKYLLNTLLTVVLGAVLLVCLVYRTLVPAVILPKFDIPNIVLLSLAVLVADHFLAPRAKRNYVAIAIFSSLSFALMPFAAGFIPLSDLPLYALFGGVVFTVTAWLYTAMIERLSGVPCAKGAPIFGAVGLYLAAQCFAGVLL